MSKIVRKRGPRINGEQLDYIANYMLAHEDFAAGRFSGPTGVSEARTTWQKITVEANKLGPHKTVEQWQKAWKDMKSRSRNKIGNLRQEYNRTGNICDKETEPLMDVDKKVLSVIGSAAAEGLNGVADSLPESVSELRKLIAGDTTPLTGKPRNNISMFNVYDINLPVIKNTKENYNVIASNSEQEDTNKSKNQIAEEFHVIPPYPTLIAPSTQSLTHTQPTSRPTSPHTPRLSATNIPSIINSPIHAHTSHSPATHTPLIINSPIHAHISHSPATHTPSLQKVNKKSRTVKRKAADEKTEKFIQLQSKQNEILETMSKAMMLAAQNESRMIDVMRENLDIKRQKLIVKEKFNDKLGEILNALTNKS